MTKVPYQPQGSHAITPALAFRNARDAIKWYQDIFDAKEKMRLSMPDGSIAHAEVTIGDSVIMVSEENAQYNSSPKTLKGNSINLFVYVPDVDNVVRRATDNGAKLIMPPADQFYGDRSGRIEDPFGYIWVISTHTRDVTEEEMKKAIDEMMTPKEPV